MDTKKRLLEMYEDALLDASGYYKSDYSMSSRQDKARDEKDAKLIEEFKKLLEEV